MSYSDQIHARLDQLHKARPKLDRWIDVHFKLGKRPAYVLSFQLRTASHYNPFNKLKNCRYRLSHIHYRTEIHWEYGEDLLADLREDHWTRGQANWVDGHEYFDIFPIMSKLKLASIITNGMRLPNELIDYIIDFTI